jgi:hypothetical protein
MIKKKIITRLIGGIGNQLFQIQHALNLQEKFGGELIFDDSFLVSSSKVHEKIDFNLIKLTDSFSIKRLNWIDLKLRRTFERIFYKFGFLVPKFLNPVFCFENSEIRLKLMSTIILDGFWQNASYLNDKFLSTLRTNLLKEYSKSLNRRYVCVHVRRGDYLTNHHWFINQQIVLSKDYYFKAFQYFQDKINLPLFEIYTDDESWANVTFNGMSNVKVISTKNLRPFQLLARMASYKNYIIANSTLSWWSAVASSAINKQVLLPKIWGKNLNSSKYKLSGWNDI